MSCTGAPNLRQMTGFGGGYEYRIGAPAGRDSWGILRRVRSFRVGKNRVGCAGETVIFERISGILGCGGG